MKKISFIISLLSILALSLFVCFADYTQPEVLQGEKNENDNYYQNGEYTTTGTRVENMNNTDFNSNIFGDEDSIDSITENIQDKSREEIEDYLRDLSDKYSDDDEDKVFVININGTVYSSHPELTSQESSESTNIDNAYEKDVTAAADGTFFAAYKITKDNSDEDSIDEDSDPEPNPDPDPDSEYEEDIYTHTDNYYTCTNTHSNNYYNDYAGPFERSISSLSISIKDKQSSYKAGDTITLVGTRIIYKTIKGNGTYSLTKAYNNICNTPTKSCPTGEHPNKECGLPLIDCIYTEGSTATPHYETVILNFKGFNIEPVSNLVSVGDNNYKVPNYTDNDGDGYSDDWTASFKIIKVIPTDLDQNTATGIAEGPITPTSDPSGTKVAPTKVPFTFTPDDEDKIVTPGNSDKYKLTISAGTGGTVSGSKYPAVPGNIYPIMAQPNSGYTFAGWYKLDGTKTTYSQSDNIKMPNSNLTLIAKFSKGGKIQNITSVTDTGLTIKSIRDLRWKSYFIDSNGYTGSILSVPSKDDVLLKSGITDYPYTNYTNLKMGYAVEMELDTLHVSTSDNPTLYVTATFLDESGNKLTGLKDGLTGNSLASYFTSFNSKDHANTFNITQTPISMTNNNVTIPGIKWDFIYYLPASILDSNGNPLSSNILTVKLDIKLKASDGTLLLDYITYLNNNKCPWTGKVFNYSTRQSLLNDIDNDLTN